VRLRCGRSGARENQEYKMTRIYCYLILLIGLIASPAAAQSDSVTVWVEDSVTKVQQGNIPQNILEEVTIAGARNEYESFQVVVSATSNVNNVDVIAGDLIGPGSATISSESLTLYRVNYVDCEDKGWLPDSLVPYVDPNTGSRISSEYGAPFDISSGVNGVTWVEVYIPADAVPGSYSGSITVTVNGNIVKEVPIELTVWSITLPDTSTLLTYFCLSENPTSELIYLEALHDHRIDVWYFPEISTPTMQGSQVIWDREFDNTLDAYFDGSLFADGVPGKNYLFGYGMWNVMNSLRGSSRNTVLSQFEEHYKNKPYIDQLAWFFIDEPDPSDLSDVIAAGNSIKQNSPSIGLLLTTTYNSGLVGLVDIWDPILNSEVVDHYSVEPEDYRNEIQQGRTAINCITVDSNNANSPNLFIDYSGMHTRIWTWATFVLGFQGIEYWNTKPVPSVTEPKKFIDQWDGKIAWGDGSLFYRGQPSELGINEEIAIPSLRLKILRDGIEDYELLSMLKDKNPSRAIEISHMMAQESNYDGSFTSQVRVGSLYWESSPDSLVVARLAIAEELSEPIQTYCGDGTCDTDETNTNCPADCPITGPICGDGTCEGVEDCNTCEADCGVCSVDCVHSADLPVCDGCIDTAELSDYIDLWKSGSVEMDEMMVVIGLWKEGC